MIKIYSQKTPFITALDTIEDMTKYMIKVDHPSKWKVFKSFLIQIKF